MNNKIINLDTLSHYNDNIKAIYAEKLYVDDLFEKMSALHVYCTNDDILRLFDASIPEEPVEPDTPVEPEVPTENIGSITENNSIAIDETQLENGTYTLRYVDSNENVIGNFNEITSFEINK